jgi:hypothetical protein
MFLSKDQSRIIPKENLFQEYAYPLSRSGPGGKKGDVILRAKETIYGVCESFGNHFQASYKAILSRDECVCRSCAIKKTSFERYGDETFNGRDKAKRTNVEKYGYSNGPCRKGINKGVPKSKKTRKKMSEHQKERLKNKANHPLWGKSHRQESNEKNRQSQFRNIENGFRYNTPNSYESGSFYSNKLRANVTYRSSYERAFLYLLEKSTEYYQYEPLSIPYVYNGEEHRYIPDFLVKDFLIEIKPKRLQERSDVLAKKEAAEQYCLHNGLKYRMVDYGELVRFVFGELGLNFQSDFLTNILKESKRVAKIMIKEEQL